MGKAASSPKVAVVTGSNRGIGFAIVKGLLQRFDGVVYLTSRDEARGRAAVDRLRRQGLSPLYHRLDVADRASVQAFRDHLLASHGGLDLLVNNAGVANNDDFYPPYEECKRIVDVCYRSVLTIQELLFPLLRPGGRVLHISSDCGHLSNVRNRYWIERLSHEDLTEKDVNEFVEWFLESVRVGNFKKEDFADEGRGAAYRVAKVALSAVTRVQQRGLAARGASINSMHPGLVRTDMTRGAGFLDPDEAAQTPLYLLLEAPPSLRGQCVWFDRRVLDWADHTADYWFKTSTLHVDNESG